MKRSFQLLGTVGAFALSVTPTLAAAAPAGTAAGTDITNQVTVTYQVGGVNQTPVVSNTDSFKVDRKIDLTVVTQDSSAVVVTPGQTNAVTTFQVTNSTNQTIDFLLAATQQASGTAAKFAGNDGFDATNVRIYVETNGTAGLQIGAGGDTLASSLSALAPDAAVMVYVVSDMVISAGPPVVLPTNGQIATVILTATAATGATAITGRAGSGGTAITEYTAPANAKTTLETLFADLTAADTQTGDTTKNGRHAARSDYRVDTAALSLTKVSRLVSDPINGTTNPKHIPGAVVEYCIVVQNASTTVDATAVKVTDAIDTLTLDAISAPTLGGTYDSGTATCSGGAAGTWGMAGPTNWEYTFATVARNSTSLLRFQAAIK